jgi:M6 family metalloprotease-like protein
VAALTRTLARPEGVAEPALRAAAAERRGLLRELIPADPAAALACRLTHAQRQALPAAVAALLETPVDAFGRLEVLAICGPQTGGTERFVTVSDVRRRAYLAGARALAVSRDRLPVHGIAVDDLMAVAAEPYRVPDPGELGSAAVADGEGLEVLVGEERRVFAARGELDTWAERTRAAETVLPPALGVRKILFVMIDFADAPGAPTTEAGLRRSMEAVNSYYKEMSANRLSFEVTVLPAILRAPQTKAAYNADSLSYNLLMTNSIAALESFVNSEPSRRIYDRKNYQHVVLTFSEFSNYVSAQNPGGWAGKADVLGDKMWLNGDWSAATIAHELGHNLGLQHAYGWKPTSVSPAGAGEHLEYGDPFDVMGGATSHSNAHICTPKKYALGFISESNLISVRSSGEYRLYRHDGEVGGRAVGLKIDAGNNYDYWIEYRARPPVGMVSYGAAMAAGVQLRWNKLPSFTKTGSTGTYLLDMTPGSNAGMKDSMLTLGNSFFDSTHKIRVTPLRKGSSVEGDWIDVAVVLEESVGNRPPVVQGASSSETAFARVPVNLSARAADPDGNSVFFQWDFGDGEPFYSTAATIQKQWSSGGVYSVTVKAFDVFGGESRQSFQIKVEDPTGSWTKVSVPNLGTENLHAVCFGAGKFVAVGAFVACASPDGKQWVKSSSGTSTMYAYSVAFGGGRYVAVGGLLNLSSASYSTGIFYSSDGVSWSTAPIAKTEWLESVTYGLGRFVAVGEAGLIMSSTDGQNWSSAQPITKKHLYGIAFNGSEFIAVGDGQTALYSSNGTFWSDVSPSVENTEPSTYSILEGTGGTSIVPKDGGWYVMSSWRYVDLSARIAWGAPSTGRWKGIKSSYMPFSVDFPEVASFAGGSSLITFPSNSATSAAAIATSTDGVFWSTTSVGAEGSGPLRGGVEANGRIILVGNRGQIYYSADGPPALARQPQAQTVTAGTRATLSVTAYATGPFTYQWRRNGVAIAGATGETLALNAAALTDSGEYSVQVTNNRGSVLSAVASLTVRPLSAPPVIVAAPTSRVLTQGTTTQLTVTASGTPEPSYQWFKDGLLIPGATSSSYTVRADGSASAGAYAVEVSNSLGKVTSAAATVRVIPTNRLANLSVRSALEAGQTLIVGAVLAEGSKAMLLRAAGPALNQFGLNGLPNPAMELYAGGSRPLATNDDWNATLAPLFQSAGAFGFVVGSRDAALNPTIGGAFTVQVKGPGSGAVLVEAYDLGAETSPRLVNLSARHWVGTDADVLIAGFVVAGSGTKQVLIRAVGPTLATFGVAGALVDPELEVLDGASRVLGRNNNWDGALAPTFARVGAFPLAAGSRDAAALVTLPAGSTYTVKVSGVNNTSGEALVEVYEVF